MPAVPLVPTVYGLSDPELTILDEDCIVIWTGENGFPTSGSHAEFSAIDLAKRCAVAKRCRATEEDWTAAIKAA